MNISVVTTSNLKGWKDYTSRMVKTFNQYWDPSIKLYFYNEDIPNPPEYDNVIYRELPDWFIKWKKVHKDNKFAHGRDPRRNRKTREYDFRLDCVKFSHKIAALTDIGLELDQGLLIWLDADTVTHEPVDPEWLYQLRPKGDVYMSWLDRARFYPECGFMIFDCSHRSHRQFMEILLKTYKMDKVFKYNETHDSYVIEKLVHQGIRDGMFKAPKSISGQFRREHHVFPHTVLGERLDHAKGPRKRHGRTSKNEVRKAGRKEAYWK